MATHPPHPNPHRRSPAHQCTPCDKQHTVRDRSNSHVPHQPLRQDPCVGVSAEAQRHLPHDRTSHPGHQATTCRRSYGMNSVMNGDTMTACAEVVRCHGSTYGSQPRSVNSLSTARCPLPQPGRGCCAHSSARCAAAADVVPRNLKRHTERQDPHVAPRSICAPARQRTGEHPILVGSGARHVPLVVAGSTMDATRQCVQTRPRAKVQPVVNRVCGRPARPYSAYHHDCVARVRHALSRWCHVHLQAWRCVWRPRRGRVCRYVGALPCGSVTAAQTRAHTKN